MPRTWKGGGYVCYFHVLSLPVFTAKPTSLQAFNNTSAFLSIVLISSPVVTNYSDKLICHHAPMTSYFHLLSFF